MKQFKGNNISAQTLIRCYSIEHNECFVFNICIRIRIRIEKVGRKTWIEYVRKSFWFSDKWNDSNNSINYFQSDKLNSSEMCENGRRKNTHSHTNTHNHKSWFQLFWDVKLEISYEEEEEDETEKEE